MQPPGKTILTIGFLFSFLYAPPAQSEKQMVRTLRVGDVVSNVFIRDVHNRVTRIPQLGKRVLTVWYNDVDVASNNEHLAKALKEAGLPSRKFLGVGIANLKDAPWIPNLVLRAMIRNRIERIQRHDPRIKNPPIFTDPNYSLKHAWRLGPTDNSSFVIVVDRSRTVRYIKKGTLNRKETSHVVALARELVHKGDSH